MEIIYKDKNIVAVLKDAGIPSQSDLTGDEDAMTITARMLSELGESSDLWLVHRLDRTVGGVLVFARTKQSAAALSLLVSDNGMEKEYLAIVEGRAEGGELRDYLYKDARLGKAFVVDKARKGVKEAVLEYRPLAFFEDERGVRTLIRVMLHTGRFHQIRVQLASRGHSLVGDGKYGNRDNKAKMPALFATRLSFEYKNKTCEYTTLPDLTAYPWSIFREELYND